MGASPTGVEVTAQLRAAIKERPTDAATVCARLGISQSTFSRLRKELTDVISFGAARSTQYGVTRSIGDLGSVLPIYEVQPDGAVLPFGELRTLQNDWNVFTAAGSAPQVMQGLPYFMQDLRPQGYMGRLIPSMNRNLQLPENIQEWSDDDTLRYLSSRGENAPGNLIVGNESYRRFLSSNASGELSVIAQSSRQTSYADLADRANQGDVPGSSSGGEQPKFTTSVMREDGRIEHVIVKFSASVTSENGLRWSDLLVAEHLALETLRKHAVPASESEIVTTSSRTYLEVVRFDRVGISGRVAIVSMSGVDCLLGSLDKNWTNSTMLLRDSQSLSSADWETVRLLDVFGALIGNSDRHPGNLSLFWDHDGRFALAPAYDMLPMMYQPTRQGEIVDRQFDMAVLDRLDLRCLRKAATMALDYCHQVERDERISVEFKQIARRHAAIIANVMMDPSLSMNAAAVNAQLAVPGETEVSARARPKR